MEVYQSWLLLATKHQTETNRRTPEGHTQQEYKDRNFLFDNKQQNGGKKARL